MIERFIHKHFDLMVRLCVVWVFLCFLIAAASTFAPTTPAKAEEQEQAATEPETVMLYNVPLDEDLQLFIINEAQAHGIDPAIIISMIYHESTYNANAVGDNGNSLGLMQVNPQWHSERMSKLSCTDLFDPYQNVTVGIDYLAELKAAYDGNIEMALVAYNLGPTGANKHFFSKGKYSSQYGRYVLATAEKLKIEEKTQ